MPQTTELRLATDADAPAVLTLVSALLEELGGMALDTEALPAFRRLVDGDAGFIALGEARGQTVAACTVSFVDALRSRGRYGVIQEMYVVPATRGDGVGGALLAFVLAEAKHAGCAFVELGTPLEGGRQVSFYDRHGFSVVGERLRWPADDLLPWTAGGAR